MGGAEEFFGIGARGVFEAIGEIVRVIDGAAVGSDQAFTLGEVAFPDSGSETCRHIKLLSGRINDASNQRNKGKARAQLIQKKRLASVMIRASSGKVRKWTRIIT
jgi:hypothetical protein